MMRSDLCILIPVAPRYSWLLQVLQDCLKIFWPDHPPIILAQASPEDTTAEGQLCWTQLLHRGVNEALCQGFSMAYLILEEQLPVSKCHSIHLNQTLPALMDSLPACHISLMGWDNRRHPSKSPVLGKQLYCLKHLTSDRDPRFNLHPGLWRLDVLLKCCDEVLGTVGSTASAWQFERISAPLTTESLGLYHRQCFQICAASMALQKMSALGKIRSALERFFFMRLLGLMPFIQSKNCRERVFQFLNFDRVFSNGPYPMVFSGVMAKGIMNPHFKSIVKKLKNGNIILNNIEISKPQM
jgi:hypothetical protein